MDQEVEGPAGRRIGGQAARGVGAAADGAHHQFAHVHRGAGRGRELRDHLFNPSPARLDRRAGAGSVLDDQRLDRSAGATDRVGQAAAVETLAPQGNQQHRAHIGVGAKLLQDPGGVGIWIATGEADQVYPPLAKWRGDLSCHVMRALDQVGDRDDVANPLASVQAKKSVHKGSRVEMRNVANHTRVAAARPRPGRGNGPVRAGW